jgi:hypothetical protein
MINEVDFLEMTKQKKIKFYKKVMYECFNSYDDGDIAIDIINGYDNTFYNNDGKPFSYWQVRNQVNNLIIRQDDGI